MHHRNLVFGIAELISFLSQGTTLEAGTIILTGAFDGLLVSARDARAGTPAGVGTFFKPAVTLQHGDVCCVEIGGGIGTLVNEIVYE